MIERLMRNPMLFGLAALAVVFLLANTVRIVPETQQGVILRFGNPTLLVNRYQPKQQFGGEGAGLLAVLPFADSIIWIDKRVRDVDMVGQQVLSTDQYRLNVDAFARYRIVDPLRMYISARTEDRVADQLAPILGSVVRNELGKRPFAELLSPERGVIMQNVRRALDVQARQYGAEIVDVRIKRADLPEGTPLDSAFERMRSARNQEALTIQANGQREAQIIRAEADAQSAKIYAAAFGKDAQFYDFYRAMQSYRLTFAADAKGTTNMVLSPQNDYLREFRGQR